MKYILLIIISVGVGVARWLYLPGHDIETFPNALQAVAHMWLGALLAIAIGWTGWWTRGIAIGLLTLLVALEVAMYVTNGDLSIIHL